MYANEQIGSPSKPGMLLVFLKDPYSWHALLQINTLQTFTTQQQWH